MEFTGTVKFFNVDKGYGFVFLDRESEAEQLEVHFEFGNGSTFDLVGDYVCYTMSQTMSDVNGNPIELRKPRTGDRLTFDLAPSPAKGKPHMASPWGYIEHKEIVEEMRKLPVYRVSERIDTTKNGVKTSGATVTVWEGRDLVVLSKLYPISASKDPLSADSTRGKEQTLHWWETRTVNDPENTWHSCSDPRLGSVIIFETEEETSIVVPPTPEIEVEDDNFMRVEPMKRRRRTKTEQPEKVLVLV